MKSLLKYQRLTILWALFVFVLCTIKLGGVGNSPMFFPGFDKLVHCGFFFVLVVFISSGLIRKSSTHNLSLIQAFFTWLVPIIYGGVIELLQAYVFTWRSGDWADLFADGVGASMGIFAVLITLWSSNNESK